MAKIPTALAAMSPVLALVKAGMDKHKQNKAKQAGTKTPGTSSADTEGDKGMTAEPSSYKRGGKVKRGGKAKVHKGEVVLTKRQARMRGKRGSAKR